MRRCAPPSYSHRRLSPSAPLRYPSCRTRRGRRATASIRESPVPPPVTASDSWVTAPHQPAASSNGSGVARSVGEDDRTVREAVDVGEVEADRRGVDVLEDPLSRAGHYGHDPQPYLIVQIGAEERGVELAGAVLNEAFARLRLEARERARGVGA